MINNFLLHNNSFTIQTHIVLKIYFIYAVQYEKQKLPSTSRSLKIITSNFVCHIKKTAIRPYREGIMHQFWGLPEVETLHDFLLSLFCFIFCFSYRLYSIALYYIELYCIVLFYFPEKKK